MNFPWGYLPISRLPIKEKGYLPINSGIFNDLHIYSPSFTGKTIIYIQPEATPNQPWPPR